MDTKPRPQIATFCVDGYFEVKMFTQCEMTAEMSIQREERGVGFLLFKEGMRKKQMGRETAPELPR